MIHKEFAEGKVKELEIARYFEGVIFATETQDIFQHWDFSALVKGERGNIDAKSRKKHNRWDVAPDENVHWIEILNVNGEKGWLCSPYTNYFVFETDDYLIVVERLKLYDFIAHKAVGKSIGSSKELYELYRRQGRKDVIMKIKTHDLMHLKLYSIKKDEQNS